MEGPGRGCHLSPVTLPPARPELEPGPFPLCHWQNQRSEFTLYSPGDKRQSLGFNLKGPPFSVHLPAFLHYLPQSLVRTLHYHYNSCLLRVRAN